MVLQENGDYNSKQQWRPSGRAFSSTGSGMFSTYMLGLYITYVLNIPVFVWFNFEVLGREFEGERDGATDAEWKERVDKWKARQEKRGLLVKGEQTKDQDSQSDEEEFL